MSRKPLLLTLGRITCQAVKNNEGRTHQSRLTTTADLRKAVRSRTSLILLITIAAWATCGTSYAQTVIGSAGAGFQTWKAGNLNDNGAPYWDTPGGASDPNDLGKPAEKNVGFCLTSSGDCQGIGSALFAPGALPFWGMPYNSATDSGGARDPKVYFKGDPTQVLRATLYLNLSASGKAAPPPKLPEINEFGWFETNSTGTTLGATHMLFQGNFGGSTPSPVGATVNFTPTEYYGYYYRDFSEDNCFTYTLFNFNQQPGCFGSHNFVVFTTNPSNKGFATFWIAGEDPASCFSNDADCNLTLVKVQPEQ